MAYQPKSYRKFLAGTVSAAVVASAIAPVASASFTDVAGSVHANDIATLVAKGYIKGYADGTFKPDKPLTRGEAAIIFSRILKDAGVKAPEQGAGFPDVPASKAELAEAVAIVKAAGVMGGDEKGNFNPNANITRQEMAKVVVEAFKLTKPANHTTKITDLDKAGSWAREYIQTLEANGVTKNTEFAPKQNVTRGQFASFVVRAMDVKKEVSAADITAVKLVDEKTLEVTFNGELKEVKKEDFAIQGVEIDSVSIKAAAAAEAKTTVVVIKTKTALQEGKSYSVSYKGQTTDKAKVDVPVVTPKVESVSAINAKQVKVTFNKAINRVSLEDRANFEIKGPEGTKAIEQIVALSDKEALITLDIDSNPANDLAFNNGSTYTLKVKKDLKLANGTTLGSDLTKDFTVSDLSVPTVTDVKALGLNKIQVTFSEPVKNANATSRFVVKALDKDNAPTGDDLVSRGSVNYVTADNTRVIITLGTNMVAGQNYRLFLNNDQGITDYAGYKVPSVAQDIKYEADTTVPEAVEASVISQKYVLVKFNKPVDAQATDFYWNTDGSESNDANKATDVLQVDEKTYRVEFGNLIPAGNINLFVKGVQDYVGNTAPVKKFTLTVANDVNPAIESITLVDKDTIKVKYNVDINETLTSKYTLTDKDGKVVPIKRITHGPSGEKNIKLVELYTPLKDGDYTLKVSGVKDGLSREIPETTQKLSISSVTTIAADVVKAYKDDTNLDNQTIVVSFDTALNVSGNNSALDKSKWLVATAVGTKSLDAISGATVDVLPNSGNKAFKITLPEGTLDSTTSVQLSNVTDANGKLISPFSTGSIAVTTPSAYAFDLGTSLVSKAEATDKRTIKLTVKTYIDTLQASDFVVKSNGTTKDVTGVTFTNNYADGNATITITLKDDVDAGTYTVTSAATTSTKDVYGNKLVPNKAVAVTKKLAAKIEKAAVTDARTIKLFFESRATTIEPVASDFTVKDANGKTYTVSSAAANGTTGITLTTSEDLPANGTYTVTVKSNGLTRVAGVALPAGDISVYNFGISKVEYNAGDYAGKIEAADKESITITFAESVDPESLLTGWTGAARSVTGGLVFNDGGSDTPAVSDSLTLDINGSDNGGQVATITFDKNVISTDFAADATFELVDTNKLKVTFGGNTTNYAGFSAVSGTVMTLAPAATITNVAETPINTASVATALQSSLLAPQTITLKPSGALDNTMLVSNNYGATYAQTATSGVSEIVANEVGIYTDAAATTSGATIGTGGTLTAFVAADGTVTFKVTGNVTTGTTTNTVFYVKVTDGSTVSNILKVTVGPVAAANYGANGSGATQPTITVTY
ncbi:S-layer homology domain-containing protein [Bhargavaea massiliensis]